MATYTKHRENAYRIAMITINGGHVGFDDALSLVRVSYDEDGKIYYIDINEVQFSIADMYGIGYLKGMMEHALEAFALPVLDLTWDRIGFCWNDKHQKKIDYANLKELSQE